jgi:hypothetical protein
VIALNSPPTSGSIGYKARMLRLRAPTLVALLALGACGFEAPQPARTPPPAPPQPPLSTLSATLTVPASEILILLNDRTKSQLAKVQDQAVGCLITKCNLNLVAVRTGQITGEATGSGMHLRLPFDLKAKLDLKTKLLKTGGGARAQGLADTTTQLALKPDWRVESHTDGQVHLSDAQLDLGPVRMRVTQLWNRNEDHLSKPIFQAIDKRVAAAFKVKPAAEKLWRKVLQPIKVGKDPQSWLVLSPERLRLTPIHTVNNAVVVAMAADVRAHVVLGEKPASPQTPPPLPKPQPLQSASNGFAVSVPVALSYGDAVKLAVLHMKKHPLRAAGASVQIEKLRILPSGQDVVVAAHFCVGQKWDFTGLLDSCGDGYLRGVPKFDAATGKLHIDNVHYDIGTENLMLHVMKFLAGDELGKALQQTLVFDESKEIAKLENNIRAALAKPQGKGVAVTGQIKSFGTPSVRWTKDGFVALLTATGTVSASLSMKGK